MTGSTILNLCAILPDANFTHFQQDGNDTELASGFSAESAGQRLSVSGTIVKLPQRLIFNANEIKKARKVFSNDMPSLARIGKLRQSSVLYDVDIEPKIGDRVYFNYMQHYECYQRGAWIETEKGDVLLMSYDSLILSHESDKPKTIKPLNGLVLIEPLEFDKEKNKLSTVDLKKYQNKVGKLGIARVELVGGLCRGYMEDLDIKPDKNELMKNHIILYKPLGAHLLEWGLHQKLYANRRIMAIHRKNILYIK
jgi:hypothetical protein